MAASEGQLELVERLPSLRGHVLGQGSRGAAFALGTANLTASAPASLSWRQQQRAGAASTTRST